MDRCSGCHDITEILLKTALTFSQITNLRPFQTEGFANDNFIFDKMAESSPNRWKTMQENTEGKGEIAHKEQFLLFPQCFLKI